MDLLSHLLAITVLLALALLYNQWRSARSRSHSPKTTKPINSPPEAPGSWPVIGHLPLLANQNTVARNLGSMADKYGPIFTIRLGSYPVLVVSTWEPIKDCFTTNDTAFANRPRSSHGLYLGYNWAGFGFAPYGPYWWKVRKLVMNELLSTRRLEMIKHVRISELSHTIRELHRISRNTPGKAVILSHWIEQLTLNIIVRMVAGKRYFGGGEDDAETREFVRVMKEFMYVGGEFVLSDLIPFAPLRWVDLLGKLRSMKRISRELDSIVERWIEEHVRRRREAEGADGDKMVAEEDFIDVMLSKIDDKLSHGHTRKTIIKATMLNLILAGSDTTAINLTWLLSTLLNNRHALKRAQEEIDTQVGNRRWAEESDINHLVYLQAVVKETLRLYPPGPISVPHETAEDCQVGGYHIPKGTRLFANVWKLHRDPRVWSDPERFMPERFLTGHASIDASGQHFEFIPFGSGRRSCPGMAFAMRVSHLVLARLLQGFEFATPGNLPVDMSEGLGITLPKATPLEVLITPRLSPELYERLVEHSAKG